MEPLPCNIYLNDLFCLTQCTKNVCSFVRMTLPSMLALRYERSYEIGAGYGVFSSQLHEIKRGKMSSYNLTQARIFVGEHWKK